MTQFEKVGVLVITGLVAVILALALFGTETKTPLDAGVLDEMARGEGEPFGEELDDPEGSGASEKMPGTAGDAHEEDSMLVGAAPWYLLTDDSRKDPELELVPARLDRSSPAESRTTWHTVRKGDNLYDLAKHYLGDGTRFQAILDANPGLNPKRLQLGNRIRIPDRSPDRSGHEKLRQLARRTSSSRTGSGEPRDVVASAPKTTTYTVKKGDTLTRIAKRLLNDSNQWQTLYAMNKDQLSKPSALRTGQKLRVPVRR